MNGPELKVLRASLGITQQQLADMLHTHQKMICLWERDEKIFTKIKELGLLSIMKSHLCLRKQNLNDYEVKALTKGWNAEAS